MLDAAGSTRPASGPACFCVQPLEMAAWRRKQAPTSGRLLQAVATGWSPGWAGLGGLAGPGPSPKPTSDTRRRGVLGILPALVQLPEFRLDKTQASRDTPRRPQAHQPDAAAVSPSDSAAAPAWSAVPPALCEVVAADGGAAAAALTRVVEFPAQVGAGP